MYCSLYQFTGVTSFNQGSVLLAQKLEDEKGIIDARRGEVQTSTTLSREITQQANLLDA